MRRTLSSVSFPTVRVLCIAAALLAHVSAHAADGLTPHFFVEGTGDVDEFPLLRTEARATIAGMVAEVMSAPAMVRRCTSRMMPLGA